MWTSLRILKGGRKVWSRSVEGEETVTFASVQMQTNHVKETGPEADFLKVRPIYLSKCIKMCTY